MNTKAKKQFGILTLTCLVIANMIGAGVFTTSGFAMGDLQSPVLVVAAWAVGGLIAIAGALSYGQLIRCMPESGGEYMFLTRGVHPMLGFVAGWVSMFAGFTAAIAVAALAFESYTVSPEKLKEMGLPQGSVASLVVVLAALLHGIKAKLGAGAQNMAVVLKVLLLFSFLGFALFRLQPGSIVNDLEPVTGWDLGIVFSKTLMWIALSYMGFNAAVYIADEVDDATNKIPKALLLGTSIVAILYVMLNYVFVYSADSSVVAGSGPNVAATAAENLGGAWFKNLFVVIISIALFTSVTSMMMAAPRVYAKMADDGMLPKLFSFQKETPLYAIVFQVLFASLIIFSSDLKQLLGYLGITLSICAAVSVFSLFLPKTNQEERPSLIQLIAPAIYVLATLMAVVMACFYKDIKELYAAIITFVIGGIFYGIMNLANRKEQDTQTAGK